MSLFRCQNLNFSYVLGKNKVPALKDVNVNIEASTITGLAGPSGSGKSTLLNLLGLLEKPRTGQLFYHDKDVGTFDERELTRIRLYDIGFIFQQFLLFPSLNAYENVEYFVRRQGIAKKERSELCIEALKAVGLEAHAHQRPSELSGGQRQRVAVARALAKRPKVIIADEPTASLDQKTGSDIMDLLFKLNEEKGISLIISSHDSMVLNKLSNILHLEDGRIR